MDEHGNETIPAAVDEGFLAGDEDDDDYEDLYNDVNVGENFYQSVNKSDDMPVERQEDEHRPDPVSQPPQGVTMAVEEPKMERSGGGGGGSDQHDSADRSGGEGGSRGGDSRVSDRVEEVQKIEERRDDVAPLASGGAMRINLGQQVEQPPTVDTNTNPSNPVAMGNVANVGNGGGYARPGPNVNGNAYGGGGGSTMLFVGDLHWWTTDADLEAELCKYGAVKEVRFYDEKASGKSKGYAQVEFFDPASATACKENMNGHLFHGRACVVAFASPFSIKRMGEAQMNRTAQQGATQGGGTGGALGPARRGPVDGPLGNANNKPSPVGGYQGGGDINNNTNRGYQGGGDNNRGGYGRGNWGRGNGQGMGGRGMNGQIRNRPGGMMGRGMMGNGFGTGPPMMPPQAMMGQGFDPTFGGPMGRMAGYGGFPGGPTPPFQGMMSSFGPVVAPHVNPAFFGRGMGMNGMGMMQGSGVEGNNMGMWSDPNMSQWGNDEHGGRVAESSFAEEEVSDHQYKEGSRDRGTGRPNVVKEKERGEREWSGSSDKRYKDDREPEYEREMPREKEVSHEQQEWQERRPRDDRGVSREREREREREYEQPRERPRDYDRGRDRHRDDRERYVDHHRYRDREPEYDEEWDRGRSSRTHGKSRLAQEESQHYRSRDVDYSKRRRTSE